GFEQCLEPNQTRPRGARRRAWTPEIVGANAAGDPLAGDALYLNNAPEDEDDLRQEEVGDQDRDRDGDHRLGRASAHAGSSPARGHAEMTAEQGDDGA